MESKRVKEVTIPLENYPHIFEWEDLRHAIRELEKCQIDSNGKKTLPRVVLIFNRDVELVGIARRRDILRGLEPEFLVSKPLSQRKGLFDVKMDPNLSELSYDKILAGIEERTKRPISDVMLEPNVLIDSDEHIIKAIYEMVDNNLSVIPVIEDDRVIGVLRSEDVLRVVAEIILEPDELERDCD